MSDSENVKQISGDFIDLPTANYIRKLEARIEAIEKVLERKAQSEVFKHNMRSQQTQANSSFLDELID